MKISSLKIISTSVALLTGFSVIGFAQSAIAQSATFNFDTTITPGCNLAGFNTAATSTVALAVNGNNDGLLTPTPASFSIACNFEGAGINITTASEDMAASAMTSLTAILTKTNDSTTSQSTGGAGNTSLDLGATTNNFTLGLTTDHTGNGLVAGSYNYSVIVTVTGNN